MEGKLTIDVDFIDWNIVWVLGRGHVHLAWLLSLASTTCDGVRESFLFLD